MTHGTLRLLLPAPCRHLPCILVAVVVLVVAVCAYLFAPLHPITATCKDGTVSYSNHRSGTCSRHGGVLTWKKDMQ